MLIRGNLFECTMPAEGERFDVLAKLGGTMIERIVSSTTPDPTPYDQTQDEWVLLVRGHAMLSVEGRHVELHTGDYVLLPAHTRHQVLSTSDGALWLAVHVVR